MKTQALFILLLLFLSVHLSAQRTDKRSYAFKQTEWYFSIYPLFIPEYSEEFQQSFNLVQNANRGNPFAQHELGLRYLTGEGFPVDTLKGFYWIQKAAGKNLPEALYNTALFYQNGWAVEWNPKTAFRFFRKSAELKFPEAQFILGVLYTEGFLMPKNIDSAFIWLRKAGDQGFQPAKEALTDLRAKYSEPQFTDSSNTIYYVRDTASQKAISNPLTIFGIHDISADSIKAIDDPEAFQKFINTNDLEMKTHLGFDSSDNITRMNAIDIVFTIDTAANNGSPEANMLLGRLYENGIYLTKNPVRSLMYYLRALRLEAPGAQMMIYKLIAKKDVLEAVYKGAGRKEPDALYVYATLNLTGYNSQLDPQTYMQYYDIAAAKNHIPSLIEAGQCYFTGKPGESDTVKAFTLWNKAAKLGSEEAKFRMILAGLSSGTYAPNENDFGAVIIAERGGSIIAQLILAYCLQQGKGVEVNKALAQIYYRRAIFRGSEVAYNALRKMYEELP